MSMIDDDTATVHELSEELIFLIAAVSTDAQRKRAIDLFRRFSRLAEAEAFRRGQDSVSSPLKALPPPSLMIEMSAESTIEKSVETLAPDSDQPLVPDHRVSLIPPVSWQD
jgi:hypothetical protein